MSFPVSIIGVAGWVVLLAGLLYFLLVACILKVLMVGAQADRRAARWEKQAGIFEGQLVAKAVRQIDAGPAMTMQTLIEEEGQHAEDDAE